MQNFRLLIAYVVSPNSYFDRLLLNKVYNVWPKKLQSSYVSWNWKVMQNLTKNWLVVSLENDMRNFFKFLPEYSKVLKLGLRWDPFIQSKKCTSVHSWMMQNLKRNWLVVSKLTGEIWRTFTQALKCLTYLHFNLLILNKVYIVMFELKRHWTLIQNLKKKLTCAFNNDMRNLANFHRLKNSDFISESKTPELNQNKNSKQQDRPDAVRKRISPWK